MTLNDWDEIRTAYHVARLGTVSAAAEVLGVHHATVIRHIDALEAQLGGRLFQRHARGYTATEAGLDLLKVARATDENFSQLANRIRGQTETVSGELVVTALPGMADLLAPVFARYLRAHPQVELHYKSDARLFRLEFGEAHVAIRAGAVPQEPDNVVQPFISMRFGLYAHPDYLRDALGTAEPPKAGTLSKHRFVLQADDSRAPFAQWLEDAAPGGRVVLRTSDSNATTEAVRAGVGIGFLPQWPGERQGERQSEGQGELQGDRLAGLVPVPTPGHSFAVDSWLVTHVDLHRTTKVQSFLQELKSAAATFSDDGTESSAKQDDAAERDAAEGDTGGDIGGPSDAG